MSDKEDAYDEHISPLMTKIIRLCKLHKINMAALPILLARAGIESSTSESSR